MSQNGVVRTFCPVGPVVRDIVNPTRSWSTPRVFSGETDHFVEVIASGHVEAVTREDEAIRLLEACDMAHCESDGRHESHAGGNGKQSERNGIQRLEQLEHDSPL